MSGMQLRLQRELFAPNNEQLLSLVHCLSDKDKSKTKDIYLCLINETDYTHGGGLTHNLIEVKGQELKRKRTWTLHELKSIDAKHNDHNDQDTFQLDFELGFNDKRFTYKAVNYEEKKRFLATLLGLTEKFRLSVLNLPPDLVVAQESLTKEVSDQLKKDHHSWPISNEVNEAYQAINDR